MGVDDLVSLPMRGRGPLSGMQKLHGGNTTIAQVTTVSDVVIGLAELTRPEMAASWDPVGLQLGDMGAEVETVGVCHEVNEDVVAKVEEASIDLLVTYHPLLFTPTNRLVDGRSAEARALALIRGGTNLLVTHTDFDAAPRGTSDALAALVSLKAVEPFGADEDQGMPAIGRVGEFDGSLGVLDAHISNAFGSSGLRITGDRERELERVAVVPGSGSDFIEMAAEVADALVTGDVSHHRCVRANELGLAVVDPGHIATERPGMKSLVRMVGEVVEVTHDLTTIDPTTWR